MAAVPISAAYFINSFRPSVYVYSPVVARQRLGKNVTAATNTLTAVEELVDVFCIRSVSYQGKAGDQFFLELLAFCTSYLVYATICYEIHSFIESLLYACLLPSFLYGCLYVMCFLFPADLSGPIMITAYSSVVRRERNNRKKRRTIGGWKRGGVGGRKTRK
jgi:hypothetical protein